MRRRRFLTLLGGAPLVWPIIAAAQSAEPVRRVGVLISGPQPPAGQPSQVLSEIRPRLADLGWVEGRNLQIDARWATNFGEAARKASQELIGLQPEVIIVSGGALERLAEATRTVPIVFVYFVDPVAFGYVQSLAHPGGNITGFTSFDPDVAAKWLQMLKEIEPQIARVAILDDAARSANGRFWWQGGVESAALSLGVRLTEAGVRDATEIERTISEFAAEPNGALLIMPNALLALAANRKLIIAMAQRYRLPAVYPFRFFTADGGLISYGVDSVGLWRQGAIYVDRILRGVKPGDLPVQRPTKFELVINLTTAKALGLAVPAALLARADEVIE